MQCSLQRDKTPLVAVEYSCGELLDSYQAKQAPNAALFAKPRCKLQSMQQRCDCLFMHDVIVTLCGPEHIRRAQNACQAVADHILAAIRMMLAGCMQPYNYAESKLVSSAGCFATCAPSHLRMPTVPVQLSA